MKRFYFYSAKHSARNQLEVMISSIAVFVRLVNMSLGETERVSIVDSSRCICHLTVRSSSQAFYTLSRPNPPIPDDINSFWSLLSTLLPGPFPFKQSHSFFHCESLEIREMFCFICLDHRCNKYLVINFTILEGR